MQSVECNEFAIMLYKIVRALGHNVPALLRFIIYILDASSLSVHLAGWMLVKKNLGCHTCANIVQKNHDAPPSCEQAPA